jgi:N-acetyl-gamma-glutamyl-phosphate reductase
MPKLRIAVAGATGYAGEELIRILRHHPSVQLTALAASAKWDRPVPAAEVFPRFAGSLDLPVEAFDPARFIRSCDVAFLALPHGVSMEAVPTLLNGGIKVIDLAGDFRLKDPALFTRWYKLSHASPALLGEAAYGLTELFSERIRAARLVANPGCYATSVILACAPLLKAGLVERQGIIVDAKSGLTGAGRKAESTQMFAEMNENLWPYKVNEHQHVPEIEQALTASSGPAPLSLCMVPHVVPLNRGILSNVYLRLAKPCVWEEVDRLYREFYRHAPFVRVRGERQWPKMRDVEGTNYCDIAFTVDPDQRLLVVVAAIDNLMKGAAGQAVQNLNVMAGWPETTGLL